MASQDDLGLLWYGVPGLPFSTTDPSDVLLNAGSAPPPLLSDHPRPLITAATHLATTPQLHTLSTPSQPAAPPSLPTQAPPGSTAATHHLLQSSITAPTYAAEPTPVLHTHHNQMLYDASTGDYITAPDYMYETLESYDDDSGSQSMLPSGQHDPNTPAEHAASHQTAGNLMYQDEECEPLPIPKTKKPKVHHHPLLKLKTPIAYQKDTDLSAIPIMREGMAVCEKCGAIGVKHAFYGKERKYCSLACARPPIQPNVTRVGTSSTNSEETTNSNIGRTSESMETDEKISIKAITNGQLDNNFEQNGLGATSDRSTNSPSNSQSPSKHLSNNNTGASKIAPGTIFPSSTGRASGGAGVTGESFSPAPGTTVSGIDSSDAGDAEGGVVPGIEQAYDNNGTYDWTQTYLKRPDFRAVPVKCFPHAPMSECWEHMGVGMKVEVACGAEGVTKDAYWVATVIGIAGYKACLRFEGFVEDNCCDFWVDLCSEEVYPVGWCATQGKALIPPRSIQNKYSDWKQFLMKRLTGARTLPTNFHAKVLESHKSRFRPGLNVEVVDKNRIAQMRVATVTEIIGKRLHLKYHGAPPNDDGFWCHEDAPIIHPIGWSRDIGHEIVASQSYHEKCISGEYDAADAPPSLFLQPSTPAYLRQNGLSNLNFTENMKIEAIDPLNLSTICVATVMKVLRNNYLMIRIDSYESDNTGSDWFCYHATSPCIFPPGFCQMNNIRLTPPKGYEGEFTWFTYLKATKATAAPPALFNREFVRCGFEEGMSLEATDLMDPRLVCVATVRDVKGRLLKIHFDGWEDDFDQWVDAKSCDIYPVGWCQMVGYKLEYPKNAAPQPQSVAPGRRKIKGGGRGFGSSARRRRGGGSLMAQSTHVAMAGSVGDMVSINRHSTVGGRPAPATGGVGRRGRPVKNRGGAVGRPTINGNAASLDDDEDVKKEDVLNSVPVSEQSVWMQATTQQQQQQPPSTNDDIKLEEVPKAETGEQQQGTNSDDDTSSGVASLVESEAWAEEDDYKDVDKTEVDEEVDTSNNVLAQQQQQQQQPMSIVANSTVVQQQQMYQQSTPATVLAPGQYGGTNAMLHTDEQHTVDLFASMGATTTSDAFTLSSFDGLNHAFSNANLPAHNPAAFTANLQPTTLGTMQWPPGVLTSGSPGINVLPSGMVMMSDLTGAPQAATALGVMGNPHHAFNAQQQQPLLQQQLPTLPATAVATELLQQQQQQSALAPPPAVLSPAITAALLSTAQLSSVTTTASACLSAAPSQSSSSNAYIPRLLDGPIKDGSKVQPKTWSTQDVATFLSKNDCAAYCQHFIDKGIDGPALLALNQNHGRVMELTGMKVGPSLKIQDLVKQLVALVSPAQARYQATLLKRGLGFNRN